MELRVKKKRSLVINLTSLMDVMFLLLIFFMVTTTFLSQPAIKLQLPSAKNAQAERAEPVVVHVDQLGRVYLNDNPMELGLLAPALSQQMAERTEKTVVLKADSRVSHGVVVQVLDAIKAAGVEKLSVSTSPED